MEATLIIPRPEPDRRDDHTIVVAVGGNALQPEGERGEIHEQFAHTRVSLGAVVELAARGWRIAMVHGNGPQIGDALERNELARVEAPPLPLGVLVAATAGWIGYMVQQSLQNALERAGVQRAAVTLMTQVLVDPDEAHAEPSKPIGRSMDEATATRLSTQSGWTVGQAGDRWRRLVPSPQPLALVEGAQIRRLVDSGVIVIAAGGGGIPVYHDPELRLEGVDAVVDKDRVAEVLGREIGAAVLLILTNVDGAFRAFGTPRQQLIRELRADEAQQLLDDGEFGSGSMGPKVEAAVAFVRAGGHYALIARLDQGLAAVLGDAGTRIVS